MQVEWTSPLTFDPTISLGSLITAGAMLLGGLAFVWAMKSDIKVLTNRVQSIEGTIKDVTSILVQLAKQETRLDAHEKRLDEMARGEGYVLPLSRSVREIRGD